MSVIRDIKIKNSSGTYDTYDIGADAINIKYDNSTNIKNKIDNKVDKEIGKGLFSGSYNDLTNKPTLGTSAAKDTTDTYSSTGTDPTTGKAVAAAIETLDVTGESSIAASKTISAWSETDGKVSITTQNISITKSQVSDFPAVDTTVASGSGNLITSGAVYTAIDNLPEPMVFKGTLGTGGTITTLPSAASSNEGFTYKVITAGTYSSIVCKIGDVVVSNGSEWVLIPAGDTDSDSWRNIKVNGTEKLTTALSSGSVDFVNGTNTTVSFDTTGSKISYSVPAVSTTSAGVAPQGNTVSTQSQTTKFLREDGTWATPSYTAVYDWAKASTKPSYAYSEISNTPTLGTIASHNYTAISHSVTYKLTVKNTEYTVISEWNPPANGFMFMFVNQSFSNARPSYIRVEKYLDAGGNGNKWIPVAIADQQTDAVGITGIQLPVIDYVSTTSKYRVICKQSQWDSMTGNNTIALNGFVIS